MAKVYLATIGGLGNLLSGLVYAFLFHNKNISGTYLWFNNIWDYVALVIINQNKTTTAPIPKMTKNPNLKKKDRVLSG